MFTGSCEMATVLGRGANAHKQLILRESCVTSFRSWLKGLLVSEACPDYACAEWHLPLSPVPSRYPVPFPFSVTVNYLQNLGMNI